MTQVGRRAGISLWDALVPWKVGADLRGWGPRESYTISPVLFLKELNVLEMFWLAPALVLSFPPC